MQFDGLEPVGSHIHTAAHRFVGGSCHAAGMAGDSRERTALAAALQAQEHVISRQQALGCGLSRDALLHRARAGGPWQRLLPGIYLAQTGAATVPQQEMAALLHGGAGSVLTGLAALHGLGLITAPPRRFDVLVPATRNRRSTALIRIHRTSQMPNRVIREGRRSYVLPPRAFADAARSLSDVSEVRALIAGAVQRRDCPLRALAHELDQGQMRHSATFRRVLAEVASGVRSAPEGEFRDLIRRSKLPEPMFNPRLLSADGAFIASPDAWWPRAGVAAEIDSREWHLSPADWERTMARHDEMSRCGILVLHFTPRRIRTDPAKVIATIAGALAEGGRRPQLSIVALPAAA